MGAELPPAFEPSAPFVPAPLLGNPHAQTIFASVFRSKDLPESRRERYETHDGDFVDLDHCEGSRAGAPHVVVLHGLEGSSRAGYVAAVVRGAHALGWGATALNFRSCSGEPNRLARSYHSGDTEDALEVLRRVRAQVQGPLFAVGFSLGGNVLLRLLEETGDAAPVDAAAAVSVPYDLEACARRIDAGGGIHRVYRERFLRTLKKKAREKARRFPGAFDVAAMERARGLVAFDDAVTAPLHGFTSARDYYARASSGPHLAAIRRPTLLLSASDDPMVPPPGIPQDAAKNPRLRVLRTERGGHVGFVGGELHAPDFWAEAQVLRFLSQQLSG
ncbi:hydrolase [Aggregicoccus sp. 17bor-14]|uniref:hydrolase n=1 Tax=Myxococcaceae TaxID=31 RepID=UPI0012F0F2D0|nr:hydrolase [Simulacricoccus sp. 17bor-14]MRI88071.1 hydrolase [Aggregicoccus sp. 17bor-14]